MNSRLQGELTMDKTATATKPAIDAEIVTEEERSLATRQDRPPTVEDLMAEAIRAGNTDVMEKLFAMRREMRTESAEMAFNAAMTKAQGEIRHVPPTAYNPQTKSYYAKYDALDTAIRPIYVRHGFALSFNTAPSDQPDTSLVLCDVSHEGGFSKRFQAPMPTDGKGAKGGDVMTKTHATGAAMSYGMRYLLKMIFNVAIGEDDHDGNKPGEIVTIGPGQVKELEALIVELAANKAGFLKTMQVEKLEDIRVTEFQRAKGALEARRGVVINATKVADIKVGDYSKAVKWVEGKRK